jgi:hypothetical protein
VVVSINPLSTNNTYVPFVTEVNAVILIYYGTATLSYAGFVKTVDYFNGQKSVIPYITDDAASFFIRLGRE